MRDPEDRGSVRDVIEPLAVGAGPRVCPCTQGRASTGRALRGDQPFPGVGITASEHRREVMALHRPRQAGGRGVAAHPPTRFLALVRVVLLRALCPRWSGAARPGGLGGGRVQVADDRVHDPGRVGPATAERGDGELHDEPPTG